MAVDKRLLEQCIQEAADGDQEMVKFLTERYAANENAAVKFVGGFMRSSDYTKKTQELAGQRTQYEQQSAQVETLRNALTAAEGEKNKVMNDLANSRISTAKARELMTILREKYQLTDEDLPGMSDLIETRKQGTVVDSTPPVEDRLKAFKSEIMADMRKEFVSSLMPELGALANLPLVWNEVSREHEELTGKRLSYNEQQEILESARKDNKPIRAVWEEKFGIAGDDGIRMKKRDERIIAQNREAWEKEQAEKMSRAALETVTPAGRDIGSGPGISSVFKTKLQPRGGDPATTETKAASAASESPSVAVLPGQHVRQISDRNHMSGAQRAAQKHLEKLSSGGYGGYGNKKTA